eukprot:TRINITY_DN2593_c0_g1_i1.p1 TRINITY_DN2593_c0_g1~~TRINITY_DN2593_c0_g1_i1.p1  ORF type:complete len:823 (+),score=118.23 TRINITY_DN2593_c0_g1_i1:61-2529(+)
MIRKSCPNHVNFLKPDKEIEYLSQIYERHLLALMRFLGFFLLPVLLAFRLILWVTSQTDLSFQELLCRRLAILTVLLSITLAFLILKRCKPKYFHLFLRYADYFAVLYILLLSLYIGFGSEEKQSYKEIGWKSIIYPLQFTVVLSFIRKSTLQLVSMGIYVIICCLSWMLKPGVPILEVAELILIVAGLFGMFTTNERLQNARTKKIVSLFKNEREHQRLLERFSEATIFLDKQGEVSFVNHAAKTFFGEGLSYKVNALQLLPNVELKAITDHNTAYDQIDSVFFPLRVEGPLEMIEPTLPFQSVECRFRDRRESGDTAHHHRVILMHDLIQYHLQVLQSNNNPNKRKVLNSLRINPLTFETEILNKFDQAQAFTVQFLVQELSDEFFLTFIFSARKPNEDEENEGKKDLMSLLIGSVAHELRSPLSGMIGLLSSALRDVRPEESFHKDVLDPAMRAAKHLLFLVNDLVDFSQFEHKKLRIVPVEFNIRQKLDEIVQLLSYTAASKGLTLKLEVHEATVPQFIHTDPNRLSQVLFNLLNNALKFTERGGVTLRVKREESGELRFNVIDSGIGISEDDQHRLFSTFTRLNLGDKHTMNATGAGLGLYISQNILKLMSSDGLEVVSTPGRGSTFSFSLTGVCPDEVDIIVPGAFSFGEKITHKSLPLTNNFHPTKFRRHEVADVMLTEYAKPKGRVLIVDDDTFVLLSVRTQLKKEGYEVYTASNGTEALRLLEVERDEASGHGSGFSLIILDWEMPIMSGEKTLKAIMSLFKSTGHQIPIIISSGHCDEALRKKVLALGATEFLTKPLDSSSVTKVLNRLTLS